MRVALGPRIGMEGPRGRRGLAYLSLAPTGTASNLEHGRGLISGGLPSSPGAGFGGMTLGNSGVNSRSFVLMDMELLQKLCSHSKRAAKQVPGPVNRTNRPKVADDPPTCNPMLAHLPKLRSTESLYSSLYIREKRLTHPETKPHMRPNDDGRKDADKVPTLSLYIYTYICMEIYIYIHTTSKLGDLAFWAAHSEAHLDVQPPRWAPDLTQRSLFQLGSCCTGSKGKLPYPKALPSAPKPYFLYVPCHFHMRLCNKNPQKLWLW